MGAPKIRRPKVINYRGQPTPATLRAIRNEHKATVEDHSQRDNPGVTPIPLVSLICMCVNCKFERTRLATFSPEEGKHVIPQ